MDRALLLSQLLDFSLERSIKKVNSMSKFRELAEGVKSDLADWDKRADKLMEERKKLKEFGDSVFDLHEKKNAEVRAGLNAMKEAVMDMTGGNNPPPLGQEGSETSSETFQGSEKK